MSADDGKAEKFLVAAVQAGRMKARGSAPQVPIHQPKYLYDLRGGFGRTVG